MSRSGAVAVTLASGARVYEIDGKSLPSVTTILRSAGLAPDYGAVDPGILERARVRGTVVHAACEAVDRGLPVAPEAEAYAPWVAGYRQFLADTGATLVACEEMVHHAELGYAGAFDWLGRLGGRLVLVDRKVAAEIHHTYVAPQCAGYAQARDAMMDAPAHEPAIEGIFSLQLRRDGTYRLREYDYGLAWQAFTAALAVYRYKTTAERQRHTREAGK